MTRSEGNDSARRRQNCRWKCQMLRRPRTKRRILDLRRDVWELEHINHRDAAMFCTCEHATQGDPRAFAPSGVNWSQHGIYAEHKGLKGWDTCANSSATSQMIQ